MNRLTLGGVKVSIVAIKQVEHLEGMIWSMAAQANAEREHCAKIVHADGEFNDAER